MTRARAARPARRAVARSLGLFAALLLIPAAGFAWLGWRSVEREHAFRVSTLDRRAQDTVGRQIAALAGELERLRVREAARPWYEWQGTFVSESLQPDALAIQRNGLQGADADARIVGRFEWEHGTHGTHRLPRILRDDRGDLRETLRGVYAPTLLGMLAGGARGGPERQVEVRPHPLWLVAANEERGQIQEERARLGGRLETSGETLSTYLADFQQRVAQGVVQVRYGGFRYVAGPMGSEGPALLAVRVVYLPDDHAAQREVRSPRWLLQGYVIGVRPLLPETWQAAGGVEVIRADTLTVQDGVRWPRANLAVALDAIVAQPPGATATLPSRALVLVGRPDTAHAEAERDRSRGRFLLLGAGLLVLVIVGFALLLREVRRESALTRRKEDFIAAITHELKTPLTGIRMYADMLKAGWVANPDAAEGYATRILDETARLGHLVDQVLDLAALERGVARVNAQPGDLGAAVADAAQFMASKAEEAGLALDVDIQDDLPPVSFDGRLVRPLVLNLLDNAIKYGAIKYGAIKSGARTETPGPVGVRVYREGERICVAVRDRGPGIPLALRRRIFEPFQRAEGELTRDAPGVGIGLALVKRYADAHNARIVVESDEGKGTTITVRFRL